MRLLVFADLQATDGSEVCFQNPSIRLQEYRVQMFFEKLKAIYTKYKCDGLVDLGDLTDDRSAIPVPTINTIVSCLSDYADGTNFKLIGNHEQYTRDTRIHVGSLVQAYFNIYDKPKVVRLKSEPDVALFFCPYPKSNDELAKWISEKGRSVKAPQKVLFGHFQVIGSNMVSGISMTGIAQEVLAPFNLVLLGHVHRPQSVNEKVHYVGSPFQQNWGESGEQKRVAVLDTVSLELEWVPLQGFPRYRHLSMADFTVEAQESSEDRFSVNLRNPKEADLFYRHPLSIRAQPQYDYAAEKKAELSINEQQWSMQSVMDRWMKENPWSFEASEEDVLYVGQKMTKIAEHSNGD